MKYIIASDLHGAAQCVQKLADAFSRHQADYMLLLGDLLYHGPRNALPDQYGPKRAIELLNGLADRLICVRGNCEAEVDQQVLDFPVTADYGWLVEDGRRLFMTHGHLYSPDLPPSFLARGEVVLSGHTHVPAWQEREGRWFLNPGSVSIPKKGSPNSYMTLEGSTFTWYTLEGQPYRTLVLSPDGMGVLK
ncbi:MAG: phosphodiesterase [Oscillospiraceae bacterium]|nr:phosphodiesterase [Oscillospiraceae bacterium]